MKGLHTLSPGMRSRISHGFYAFPHAEWDVISEETKAAIKVNFRQRRRFSKSNYVSLSRTGKLIPTVFHKLKKNKPAEGWMGIKHI